MAHRRYKWVFRTSNEYEYKYVGKYGAKGEKRAEKKKPTPEQVKKQNQINRVNRMRRLIKANFEESDLWITLKYPKGTRVTAESLRKDLDRFVDKCRREYRKRGAPFKYVIRKEIGRHGGIHAHILINRPGSIPDVDKLIKKLWTSGSINYTPLYEAGGYQQLAEYIVKQPDEQTAKQLSLFPEEEKGDFLRYSCSRNLIRQEPEVTEYGRRTMRRLLTEGPQPTPGYAIDKNSVCCGVNPYTGLSYFKYIEYRVSDEARKRKPGGKMKSPPELSF